jgi:hypothetical protein
LKKISWASENPQHRVTCLSADTARPKQKVHFVSVETLILEFLESHEISWQAV